MIIPQSVMLEPTGITVSFLESEELDVPGGIIKAEQLSIPGDVCKAEVDEVIDALRDLIDAALLHRRAPVDTFTARDRARAGM